MKCVICVYIYIYNTTFAERGPRMPAVARRLGHALLGNSDAEGLELTRLPAEISRTANLLAHQSFSTSSTHLWVGGRARRACVRKALHTWSDPRRGAIYIRDFARFLHSFRRGLGIPR